MPCLFRLGFWRPGADALGSDSVLTQQKSSPSIHWADANCKIQWGGLQAHNKGMSWNHRLFQSTGKFTSKTTDHREISNVPKYFIGMVTCKFAFYSSSVAQWYKNLPAMQETLRRPRFNPWVGRSLGEGNDNPLQYSCLGNPIDRGAWWATVYGVAKSWTWLSN